MEQQLITLIAAIVSQAAIDAMAAKDIHRQPALSFLYESGFTDEQIEQAAALARLKDASEHGLRPNTRKPRKPQHSETIGNCAEVNKLGA